MKVSLKKFIHHSTQKIAHWSLHLLTPIDFSEEYYSFVNGQYTSDGGTHLSAFREGLLRGINDFSNKKFSGDDVREGILGAVAIRMKEPVFESQTKNKLGNSEIRSDLVSRIAQAVAQSLHREIKLKLKN